MVGVLSPGWELIHTDYLTLTTLWKIIPVTFPRTLRDNQLHVALVSTGEWRIGAVTAMVRLDPTVSEEDVRKTAAVSDMGLACEPFVLEFRTQRTARTFLLPCWLDVWVLWTFSGVAINLSCRAVLHFPACSGYSDFSSLPIDFDLWNKLAPLYVA